MMRMESILWISKMIYAVYRGHGKFKKNICYYRRYLFEYLYVRACVYLSYRISPEQHKVREFLVRIFVKNAAINISV